MTSDSSAEWKSSPDFAIQARGLTRYFGRRCAVNQLSMDVPRGSVFAFIGRNGAGKTTTIRMLLGLMSPTCGHSSVLGYPSHELPPSVRAGIGYMAEGHPVYPWMRVSQFATFQRGCYPHWKQTTFASVIDYFSIHPDTKCGDLSHGQRAGVHLASTLAIEPDLLMLDDPATGLDPAARRSLLEAMVYFTRGRERTIFFSTHLLDDVERVADHVAILDYSVLRAACSMETFQEHVQQLSAHFPGEPPQQLPDIPGLLRVTRHEHDLTLIVANHNGRTEQVLESLGAMAVEELPLSLEDALTAYVGRQGNKSLISGTGTAP
ncbi:MAG: ABC transporter ATP-binding protein [Planctomycetaceae bacterium]|nr:ABC transporter ATP-binding protein [Planctomycetaceae bacterium]